MRVSRRVVRWTGILLAVAASVPVLTSTANNRPGDGVLVEAGSRRTVVADTLATGNGDPAQCRNGQCT